MRAPIYEVDDRGGIATLAASPRGGTICVQATEKLVVVVGSD